MHCADSESIMHCVDSDITDIYLHVGNIIDASVLFSVFLLGTRFPQTITEL